MPDADVPPLPDEGQDKGVDCNRDPRTTLRQDLCLVIPTKGSTMNIIPMSAGFGARIHNVDLARLGDNPEARQALRAALLEYGLLVIPGPVLSPQDQIAASEVFGALEEFPPAPGQIPGYPQIFRVASRATEGYTGVGRYWHSDGSFRTVPTPMSLWHLEARPDVGGDTLFTDLHEAWRSLPEEMKAQIKGLQTTHRNHVVHPLVMPHPHTGVEGLYLNVGLTNSIIGLERDATEQLIATLDRHLSREGAVYRHQWKEGDFVVADNFRVAHRATPLSPLQRRVLNRTTVRGDGAFWETMKADQYAAVAA